MMEEAKNEIVRLRAELAISSNHMEESLLKQLEERKTLDSIRKQQI